MAEMFIVIRTISGDYNGDIVDPIAVFTTVDKAHAYIDSYTGNKRRVSFEVESIDVDPER
jgi:hypothetical protein